MITALLKFFQYPKTTPFKWTFRAIKKRQIGSLTFEYAGTLDSAENSPVEGIQTAYVGEDLSYLLAHQVVGFPLNQYWRTGQQGNSKSPFPRDLTVAMDGTLTGQGNQRWERDLFLCRRAGILPGIFSAARYNEIKSSAGPMEVIFYVRDPQRDFINAHAETIGKIAEMFTNRFGFSQSK